MPADAVSINLLGDSEMEHTPVGRIVNWAVTYGRYIMIGTEIVVLLAFISRFSLDRKLTDLKEEVTQKQDIIEANIPFESDVKKLQNTLAKIKTLKGQPVDPSALLAAFQTILPPGTYLKTLNLNRDKLTATAVSGTTGSFAQFITNIQNARILTNIEISSITRDPLVGIQFGFIAQVPKTK